MTDPRKPIFDAVRKAAPGNPFNTRANIDKLHRLLDGYGVPKRAEEPQPMPAQRPARESGLITARVAQELLSHESIVLEAYKDSVGVWTWGVGVTRHSGHKVQRYKDNPSTIERALEVYVWLLRERYLPDVLTALAPMVLPEHQLAAALSFHYNTGKIGSAQWVKSFKRGDVAAAERQIMNYQKPPELRKRRLKEQALFFHGKWSGKKTVMMYPVRKPSYFPNWGQGRRVNVASKLEKALSA